MNEQEWRAHVISLRKERALQDGQEEQDVPVYSYILALFDRGVQAATLMQRAYRMMKANCTSGILPSDEDPFHHKHFQKIREMVGWSKEELYDEYGERRIRTDGGRAPRKRRGDKNAFRLLCDIRNTRCESLPDDDDGSLLQQLNTARGRWTRSMASNDAMNRILNARSNMSVVSNYLRDRWYKMKQELAKDALIKNPLQKEFKHGSQQWEKLMNWMLNNGHSTPIRMHEPALLDLQASLSVNSDSHRAKIMSLIAQFNTILKIRQGKLVTPDTPEKEPPKVNALALGLYNWAIKDTGLEFREELEESSRYASTPPEPPEGLETDLYQFHKQVCVAIVHSSNRACRLRKAGRKWVQAFEDSTQRRRRLIRTRSSGNLGLLGPPSIDASTVTTIFPLAGKPAAQGKKQWIHVQLQKIVDMQAKRRKFSRHLRPLRCINTEWMGGIDWRLIESKATGRPPPRGPRIPPKPTDAELGDLFEVFSPKCKGTIFEESSQARVSELESELRFGGSESSPSRPAARQPIPFNTSSLYVEELHDVLQESGLTGLDCEAVLGRLTAAARAATLLPPLDSAAAAAAAAKWLRAFQDARTHNFFATQHARLLHLEHAIMGSTAHDEATHRVAEEQGVAVLTRSMSTMLPGQLGCAIERTIEHSRVEWAHRESEPTQPEITWPMMLRAWRQAGLPGWQGQDGRALWHAMDMDISGGDAGSAPWDATPSPSPSSSLPRHGSAAGGPATVFASPHGTCMQPQAAASPATLGPAVLLTPTPRAPLSKKASTKRDDDPISELGTPPVTRDPYSPSISCVYPGTLASPFAAASALPQASPFQGAAGSPSPTAMKHARAIVRERRRQQAAEAAAANRAKRETWANETWAGSTLDPSPKLSSPSVKASLGLRGSSSLKTSFSTSILTHPRPSYSLKHAPSSTTLKPKASSMAFDTIEDESSSSEAEEEEEEEEGEVGLGVGHMRPPRSDMLLLRRREFWGTVMADARVILLLAENYMPWRPYWHEAGTKQKHLRVKAHAETVQKLVAYIEHHVQQMKLRKAIHVGPADIIQANAEARKHMQLNWCKLVKSEMYKWLNRYLVLGKLPSNFNAQEFEEQQLQSQPSTKEQQQPQLEELSPFERKLHAAHGATSSCAATPFPVDQRTAMPSTAYRANEAGNSSPEPSTPAGPRPPLQPLLAPRPQPSGSGGSSSSTTTTTTTAATAGSVQALSGNDGSSGRGIRRSISTSGDKGGEGGSARVPLLLLDVPSPGGLDSRRLGRGGEQARAFLPGEPLMGAAASSPPSGSEPGKPAPSLTVKTLTLLDTQPSKPGAAIASSPLPPALPPMMMSTHSPAHMARLTVEATLPPASSWTAVAPLTYAAGAEQPPPALLSREPTSKSLNMEDGCPACASSPASEGGAPYRGRRRSLLFGSGRQLPSLCAPPPPAEIRSLPKQNIVFQDPGRSSNPSPSSASALISGRGPLTRRSSFTIGLGASLGASNRLTAADPRLEAVPGGGNGSVPARSGTSYRSTARISPQAQVLAGDFLWEAAPLAVDRPSPSSSPLVSTPALRLTKCNSFESRCLGPNAWSQAHRAHALDLSGGSNQGSPASVLPPLLSSGSFSNSRGVAPSLPGGRGLGGPGSVSMGSYSGPGARYGAHGAPLQKAGVGEVAAAAAFPQQGVCRSSRSGPLLKLGAVDVPAAAAFAQPGMLLNGCSSSNSSPLLKVGADEL